MKPVVLDSNIFVAALISNKGASFALFTKLVQLAEKEIICNATSVPLVLELEEVLMRTPIREKLSYYTELELLSIIDDIVVISLPIRLNYLWRPYLKDSKDDKVLETAFNANAGYIITHNVKDFKSVSKDFAIDVVTPKEYLLKGLL